MFAAMILIMFAFQPAKTPTSNGAAPQHNVQRASIDTASPNQSQPDKPALSVNNSQTPSANHQSSNVTSSEEIKVQWDLVYLTALLVVVGIATAGVISWQSWETRRAATATTDAAAAALRATELQETGFKQWLILKVWKNTRRASTHAQPTELNIECDLVNATNFPLTYTGFSIHTGTIVHKSVERHLMAPNEFYTINFSIKLTPADDDAYLNNFWEFGLRGILYFEDVLQRKQQQPFGGFMIVYKGGARFQPHSVYEQSAAEQCQVEEQ